MKIDKVKYKGCMDVNLSKRQVIKLCKEYNIPYFKNVNINGGKYIHLVYSVDPSTLNTADVYYKSWLNSILYKNEKYNESSLVKLFEDLKKVNS